MKIELAPSPPLPREVPGNFLLPLHIAGSRLNSVPCDTGLSQTDDSQAWPRELSLLSPKDLPLTLRFPWLGTRYWLGRLPQGVPGAHSSARPAANPEKEVADLLAFGSWG